MSYRAIVEFILHLEHFRNVDLIQQGIYFLKFQLFNEKNDKIYYASPYHHESKDTEPQPSQNMKSLHGQDSKASFHKLVEPYIIDQTNSFYTKTFFIRYAEELVIFRDIVKFRTEIDISPGYLETEFFLKAELFYQSPPANNFSRCLSNAKEMQKELQNNGEQFKMVQARLFQINKSLIGQSSFLPVLFDREYTCLTMSTIHASLIDYRFRQLPQPIKFSAKNKRSDENFENIDQFDINEEDQTYLQNGIIVENKNEYTPYEIQKLRSQKLQQQQCWQSNNITEYFFFDDDGNLSISEEQVKTLYQEFTSLMKSIYLNSSKKYEETIKNIITDQDIQFIDFPLISNQIQIQSLHSFLPKELANKLNIFEDYEIELSSNQTGQKNQEELKQSEQELAQSMNHSQNQSINDQQSNEGGLNYQFQSLNLKQKNKLNELQQSNLKNSYDSSNLDDYQEGQEDETCIDELSDSKQITNMFHSKDDSSQNLPQQDSQNSLKQPPNISKNFKGIGMVNQNQNNLKPMPAYMKKKDEQRVEITLQEAQKISNAIVTQINIMAGQLFELHNNIFKVILYKPRRVYKYLSREYQNLLERSYGENILRHVVLTQDFSFPSEDYTGQLNDVVAKKTRDVIRMHQELDGQEVRPVEELNVVQDQQGKKNRRKRNMGKYAPLIFEECFIKNKGMNRIANTFEIDQHPGLKKKVDPSNCIKDYKGMHLFVLSHGFQGSSFDLRIFKNIVSIAMPDALFLCAQANEQDSDQSIFDMGLKLANEVDQYIKESCPGSQLGRLTIIGYSLGGLIVRAALPHLEKYKSKFHGFLTMCSPHLGYMYKSGKLFSTGMWVLKAWKKSIVLNQLSMSDSKVMEQTAIYELSQAKGLEWFKHVVLLSSYQDQYAPFDSARIQICGEAARDQKKGNLYIQMVNNIFSKCNNLDVLYRLDVNFNIEETNLDSVIGRTAHILFLENEELLKMIVSRYKMVFS